MIAGTADADELIALIEAKTAVLSDAMESVDALAISEHFDMEYSSLDVYHILMLALNASLAVGVMWKAMTEEIGQEIGRKKRERK